MQRTPVLLTNGAYLALIALAVAVVAFAARWPRWSPGRSAVDKLISIIAAVGVPAFVVVGMQLALSLGLSEPGVVLVGVVNGVGGGLLRDVIAGEQPLLLQPGQYQSLQVFVSSAFFWSSAVTPRCPPPLRVWPRSGCALRLGRSSCTSTGAQRPCCGNHPRTPAIHQRHVAGDPFPELGPLGSGVFRLPFACQC
ncbi:MAG: TRIC cation channel family protein [Hyphomicrobiaceae bacterium]